MKFISANGCQTIVNIYMYVCYVSFDITINRNELCSFIYMCVCLLVYVLVCVCKIMQNNIFQKVII